MCHSSKLVCQLVNDARMSTMPLDAALFVIFFIPSIGAAIFSFGSGMLIRAYVESLDRQHAVEYAAHLNSLKSKGPSRKTKKRRPH